MARRPTAKKEIIGIRLDVWSEQAKAWVSPDFSFGNRYEARLYREKHWPKAAKYRIYAVRVKADFGIPENFYFNSLVTENKKAAKNAPATS